MQACKVDAVTRLDVAVDQLLTASLLCYNQEILTEAQFNAVHRALDLLDLDAISALRIAVGLDVARELNSAC